MDVVRKHDILHGITPEKLCAIIEELGPTFIKLGQILSMRSDILPRDYCEALKKLRSNVSPMPFEQVQRVVETSYGCPMEEVFASFDGRRGAARPSRRRTPPSSRAGRASSSRCSARASTRS